MPSHENINMQGKIKSTGQWGSCLYLHMSCFLLYPWACVTLQKGRHKDTSLDKLILVLAIIYTHHNVFVIPFFRHYYTYFSSLSVLLPSCAIKSNIRIYNFIFKINSLLFFSSLLFTPIDDRTAKIQSQSHSY